MKYFIILTFSLVFFSGCGTSKAIIIAQNKQECESYGFQKGTAAYNKCIFKRMEYVEANKLRRALELREALQNFEFSSREYANDQIRILEQQKAFEPVRQNRFHCTSSNIGRTTYTDCY